MAPQIGIEAQTDSWADLSDIVFEHLDRTNGLPNPLVNVTIQDGAGFLWSGTSTGLTRWDGYQFRAYSIAREGEAKLPDTFIECLHLDPAGRLWAGLNAAGLARYDSDRDRFEVVPLDPRFSPDRSVHSIADDGAGGLWIGTEDGLDHLSAGNATTKRLLQPLGENGSLAIRALLLDHHGTLWVGTAGGLYLRRRESEDFISVPLSPGKSPLAVVSALFEDGAGRIWIGTAGQGLFSLDPGTASPHSVPVREGDGLPIGAQTVTSIAEALPGQIWLGTYGQGLVMLDAETGWTRRFRHDRSLPEGLRNDFVLNLYKDRSGQLWVSSAAGLDRYDPRRFSITTLFGGKAGGAGLPDSDIWSVLADDSHIWVGSGDGSVDVIEPAAKRIARRAQPGTAAGGLPRAVVRSLLRLPADGILAGTLEGLFHIDTKGKARRILLSPGHPEMGVDALLLSGDTIWIGSRNDGLWRIDAGLFHGAVQVAKDELTDPRVLTLAAGPEDHIWVGTRTGLSSYDPRAGAVERILPDPRDPQSLSAGRIASLLTDRKGRLWVATEGGGIDLLESRDAENRPRFRHLGVADGLPDSNINKLLMDKNGRIWTSTDNGLASIDPDTFAIQAFRQAEGVAISTYWINSGDETPQGDLLFGGIGGLTVVHPDRISEWRFAPPIAITDLRVGGRSVPAGRFSGAGPHEPVSIAPDANSLAVEFAALDLSAPERNRYEYKLEGFDADWVETDSAHRLASYTNLKPGRYVLHLRGSNRDGVWAESSLDLPIKVLPAWYQTIWFRLALAAGGVLLIVLVVRSRTAYYRRRQRILEERVERRTAELQTRTDQVKALLDHSGQGFLSFGEDLVIDNEYSLACETMLGLAPAGMTADRALFSSDARKAELFRKAAEAFRDCKDYKRRSVLLSLFPTDIRRGGLMIDVNYRRIGQGRVMAILTDVTESRRLADKLETNYRRQDMVVAAVIESRDFFEAVESYRRFIEVDLPDLLTRDTLPEPLLVETYRTVHTFKGVLRQFNFERSPKALHEFEEVLADFAEAAGSETVEMLHAATDFALLRRSLALDLAVVEGMLGSDFIQSGARIAVPAAQAEQYSDFGARLLAGGRVDLADPADRDLLRDLSRMHFVGLDRVLHGYDRMVRQLAEAQGKAIAPLAVEGGEGVLVDPRRYRDFFHSLVHVFRNAVSHGIERPDDRVDVGKDEAGMILCTVTRQAGSIAISIADDGAGLDLDLLRARLSDIGQPSDLPDEAVMQSVFVDRVSTQEVADEISGRGMGLGTVKEAVEALGGTVTVSSTPRRGTIFKFTLPLDVGIAVAEAAH